MVKQISKYLFCVMIIVSLAGCSKKNVKDGEVTLRIGVWAGAPASMKLLDNQIAIFTKKYPKIKVSKLVAVGNFNEWLQLNMASGTAPDISFIGSTLAKDFISYDAFMPLNDIFTQEEFKEFYSTLLDGFTAKGKVYGIPKDFNTLVMYYNKDMFKAAGIDHPPRTWKELESTLEKLKKAGKEGKLGKNFMYPMSTLMQWNRINPFIIQNGGTTYANNKLQFDTDAAAEAIDFFFSLVKKGYIMGPKKMGNPSLGTVLGYKNTAIIYSGGWQIPYLTEAVPNFNYGIAVLPKHKKRGSMLYTVAYAMLSKTKHPKEAALLLKSMVGTESEKLTAKSGLAVPSRIKVAEYFSKNYFPRKALATQAPYSVVFSWGLGFQRIETELDNLIERMYINYTLGDKSMKAKPLLDRAMNSLKYAAY